MAEMSDIVLPAAHWLEIDDIYDMHPAGLLKPITNVLNLRAKPNRISGFHELGKAGSSKYWFKDVETALDYQLRKRNYHLEGIQR
jgi:hypothetical protein